MQNSGINTEFFLELLKNGSERPFRLISTKMRNQIETYTTQSTRKIDSLFKSYELEQLSEKALAHTLENRLIKNVKKSKFHLDSIVKRRHQIVHSNDFNGHSKYSPIHAKSVRKRLDLIKVFVHSADIVIDEHFRAF